MTVTELFNERSPVFVPVTALSDERSTVCVPVTALFNERSPVCVTTTVLLDERSPTCCAVSCVWMDACMCCLQPGVATQPSRMPKVHHVRVSLVEPVLKLEYDYVCAMCKCFCIIKC